MYFTANKRGKMASKPGAPAKDRDISPATQYSAVDFGGGKPDGARRFTNNYGKNAKARNEVDVETGENSRRTGRMFNWMKGESF